ncbi:MAG: thermonuclease family protein [Rhizobiaceae bacterium]
MSVLGRIALFLVGAALVAALWAGGQSLTRAPATVSGTDTAATSAQRPADPPKASPPAEPARRQESPSKSPDVRVIAKGSIAGPEITGPLERIAPREPLTAATKPLKREAFGPPVPSGTLLYQPVAKAAGEIEADGYTVRLAGIETTPADRTCADGGQSWPCGVVARTAFRAWMRGRAVACDVPSHPGEIATHCTLDGEDMALWLVRNGWAESAGQYDEAEAKARQEKKGIFGPSPLAKE